MSMLPTLIVFGPSDYEVNEVTRKQFDAVLSETQPNARIIRLDAADLSIMTQLTIGSPVQGMAVVITFTPDVTRIEFDNIPDAISAFRELTAKLFDT